MAQVLADGPKVAVQQAEAGTEEDRDKLAVVLAWCESFYRAGVYTITRGSLGKSPATPRARQLYLSPSTH